MLEIEEIREGEEPEEPVTIGVKDPAHSTVEGRFLYSVDLGEVRLVGMEILMRGEAGPNLTISEIRDLPLSRWERAARAFAYEDIRQRTMRLVDAAADLEASDQQLRAEDEANLPRSLRVALRLARIAREYRANLIAGKPDPVAEIARTHRVKPATARSWIHRARKVGLLGPPSEGRGE